jgi:hypothetical protein
MVRCGFVLLSPSHLLREGVSASGQ